MASKTVFSGNYVDMKFIRSRSACQVVIEIPLERASDFIMAFGAPNPGVETPVAIARLNPASMNNKSAADTGVPPAATKPKKHWNEIPLSQQAALRCNDEEYQNYLGVTTAEQAADFVRKRCVVVSRSELDRDPEAAARWRIMDDDYIIKTRGYDELVR